MTEHYREQCKHGIVNGQCRCPAKEKTVRIVACGAECEAMTEPIEHAKAAAGHISNMIATHPPYVLPESIARIAEAVNRLAIAPALAEAPDA